jgi:hypothetical protein
MTTADRNPKTHRARLLATAALGLALTGFAGTARAADPVELTIIDRNTGQPLQVWRHDGRLFVAGQTGAGYCLRVTNHTGRRVLAILSVDGVNIYDGKTADYDDDGYVYNPYQTYDQCGWRKSLNEVAAFSFTPLPNAYAARTGRPAEVGVIGMAVFYEKVEPPPPPPAVSAQPAPPPVSYRVAPPQAPPASTYGPSAVAGVVNFRTAPDAPAPPPPITVKPAEKVIAPPPPPRSAPPPPPSLARPPAAQEAQRSEKLGTAHGALETSMMVLVDFKRATPVPAFIRQVEYDSRENLIAAGVILPPERHPDAFPASPNGFVPDPPPYR